MIINSCNIDHLYAKISIEVIFLSKKEQIMRNGVPVGFTFAPTKVEKEKKTKQDKMLYLLKENNKLLKELVKKLDN